MLISSLVLLKSTGFQVVVYCDFKFAHLFYSFIIGTWYFVRSFGLNLRTQCFLQQLRRALASRVSLSDIIF